MEQPLTGRLLVRKLLKIHAALFAVFLGVYFVLAFFDPGLLSYDMRQKFHALGADTIVVTARVLDHPMKPVVTATAICDQTHGVLRVALDWGDDDNSYSYDITRDAAPLVSGLTSSAYNDYTVVVATTYQYEVTGIGPMDPGFATSDPVSVTTPDACEITAPAPTVSITSFAGRGIDSYDGTPRVEDRRPVFKGTTNMPNATMLVTIGTKFLASFSAANTGYWEWKPPYGVPSGSHLFTVTATDPDDNSRTATTSLHFDIVKQEEELHGSSITAPTFVPSGTQAPTPQPQTAPFQFGLAVMNKDATVLQGEMLETTLSIQKLAERYSHVTVPVRYTLIDDQGIVLSSETTDQLLLSEEVIRHSIPVPLYAAPGKYIVQVEVLLDDLDVSRTASFTVQSLSLLRLSSGATITYADIVRNLGWLAFVAILFFLLWLLLFIREYALTLGRKGDVTEYDLWKAGFIRK